MLLLRPTRLPSLLASPEPRSVRKVIMSQHQTLESLDLWPGDEVWMQSDYVLLGRVNGEGVFVPHLRLLN